MLRTIEPGRPSRSVLRSGHYASVLRARADLGLAVCDDGVGTKLIVAEQTGRCDTVGIDCVAMNVNDLICVGAEPIALVDYIAVEEADPPMLRAIGTGLQGGRRGGRDRDPGRRARRRSPSWCAGTRRRGFDLDGARLRDGRARRDRHRRRRSRPATR